MVKKFVLTTVFIIIAILATAKYIIIRPLGMASS